MRIACIHLPQLSLQCVTRIDPALRGAPVVVVGGRSGVAEGKRKTPASAPVVLGCSRAAHALGARVGMLATAARALSPELVVMQADPALERETVRALGDALLADTPIVDVGGRVGAGGAAHALYCEVPAKLRGASFGERLATKLDALGLTGRIGIADDRFTAWVAASTDDASLHGAAAHNHGSPGHGVSTAHGHATPAHGTPTHGPAAHHTVSVPRGGSAAFLASRPLSLLAISSEVQHMLEQLGVRTLGEFAALPEPSVARPLEADYQALARGEGERHLPPLRPYAPEAPIREQIVVAHAGSPTATSLPAASPSLPAAIGILAARIALRLEGRGRGAARVEIIAFGPTGERRIPIVPVAGGTTRTSLEALLVAPGSKSTLITSAEALADTLAEALRGDEPVWRFEVAITGEALAGEAAAEDTDQDAPEILDTLSVVLSNTGGSLDLGLGLGLGLGLTSAREPGPTGGVLRERRETHQRTRRGKHRRRELPSVIQPKLFKT